MYYYIHINFIYYIYVLFFSDTTYILEYSCKLQIQEYKNTNTRIQINGSVEKSCFNYFNVKLGD